MIKLYRELEEKQDFIEDHYPLLEKESSFYFDNVKQIKNPIKSEELITFLGKVEKHAIKTINENPRWFSYDLNLNNFKNYFLSKVLNISKKILVKKTRALSKIYSFRGF